MISPMPVQALLKLLLLAMSDIPFSNLLLANKLFKQMKKQFQILAATFITVAFISCSKEKPETNETAINEEVPTKPAGGGGNASPVSLNKNLEGLYQFDGNLKEQTGKLADAVPTALNTHGVIYTTDRKETQIARYSLQATTEQIYFMYQHHQPCLLLRGYNTLLLLHQLLQVFRVRYFIS
jgi:hypothetical protein